MKKKIKRYNEGDVVELESKTGRNENIGDDVRARAMAAMAARESGGEETKAAPKATPKAEPKAAAPKAAPKKKESTLKDSSSSFKDSSSSFKGASALSKGNSSAFKNAKSSFKSGGSVSSASKRADGCATKGKTKGRVV